MSKYFLMLLWCVTYTQAFSKGCQQEITICVTAEMSAECEALNVTHILYNLYEIPQVAKDCKLLRVYLTSERHLLNETLHFTTKVSNLSILGARNSTILCRNSGIRFYAQNVAISNITFNNCGLLRNITRYNESSVALHFEKLSYQLENVTITNTIGQGLHAYNCNSTIKGCKFLHNTEGHAKIRFLYLRNKENASVNISNTVFYNGSSESGSGGLQIHLPNSNIKVNLTNCAFRANKGKWGSHIGIEVRNTLLETPKYGVDLHKCSFTEGKSSNYGDATFGVFLRSHDNRDSMTARINHCNFTNNSVGGMKIVQFRNILINKISVFNNTGTGVVIQKRSFLSEWGKVVTVISNSNFNNNSRALYINSTVSNKGTNFQSTNIIACNFTSHNVSFLQTPSAVVHIEGNRFYKRTSSFTKGYQNNRITISESLFEKNYNDHGNCSTLLVENIDNLTLTDTAVNMNQCTGITLIASAIKVENWLNITRNNAISGGALKLLHTAVSIHCAVENRVKFSKVVLKQKSKLSIVNNTADKYGGGIFTDETCEDRDPKNDCFFQLETVESARNVLRFSGNSAGFGGDAIFGGCLSDCSLKSTTATKNKIDITKPDNIAWRIISSQKLQSQSTFADKPTKVAFCSPLTLTQNVQDSSVCNTSLKVRAYMGQIFNISLIVADDSCTPTTQLIKAKLNPPASSSARLGEGKQYQKSTKGCKMYSYSIIGEPRQISVTLELSPITEVYSSFVPTPLTVELQGCPIGWSSGEENCTCSDILQKHQIVCINNTYSLEVPTLTWIGEVEGRGIAVGIYCTVHCQNKGKIILQNIEYDSDKLCNRKRTGVLCGACISNHSLQLGGYRCAVCSNTTYKGVLLLLGFFAIGFAMVLLSLSLNLTVSTGTLNGIIFYSNIVYLNNDALLPMNSYGNSTHLQNTVKLLFTFQAWMNLDFGITTCFFDGYNTYISTWMQFIFPLYIWLLILTIVLASRYSKRVSKLTTSNTVSVLSTLLLLSYAKLVKTSFEVASFTDAEFLNSSLKYHAWILDGNIKYLNGKHLPLFLMSILVVAVYIVPFTLLILLGPLLQAKSHYRLLNWVNKIKPFLDAFYGPYTSRYRYWPGILLLARLTIFGIFALYSQGDSAFKLVIVSVMSLILLLIWFLIGKRHNISLHQRAWLNYLELFSHSNLVFFAVISLYNTQKNKTIQYQQVFAVVMVGSVLAVFCGILVFHISFIKMFSNVVRFFPARKTVKETSENCPNSPLSLQEEASAHTHSIVETNHFTPTYELREPLLTT